MTEQLQIRIHGPASAPALVYLPGMHGDWTLAGGFRKAVEGKVRFVEMTYPRTLEWSLGDYAGAVAAGLAAQGVEQGWIVAESFGSQVLWPLIEQKRFRVEAAVLAGGFVRHPYFGTLRLAARTASGRPLDWITSVFFGCAKIARLRFRHSPEVLAGVTEFIERRTPLDNRAAAHRLRLITQRDLRPIARSASPPIYAISGAVDPVVPWPWVRRWLRKNCPALREFKVIWSADHFVLGTAPERAADFILQWMANARARNRAD